MSDVELSIARAALDLLDADARLTVFDGVVPNPTPDPPYVLVYTLTSWPADDDRDMPLSGLVTRGVVRWICHSVGASAQASREVAGIVRARLLNVRPVIAGVTAGLIRDEQDDPPQRNEQLGVVWFDTVHVYRLTVDS